MELDRYPIELRPIPPEDGGGWLALLPDLPGCMADGATPEEAVREVRDAARSWLTTAADHGDPLPEPGRDDPMDRFVIRLPRSLHVRLVARARREGVSVDKLVVEELAEAMAAHDL